MAVSESGPGVAGAEKPDQGAEENAGTASATSGVTRTEFVLRSSETAAIQTLNERPIIALDDEAWDAFVAALDAPVEPDPAVKERFARRLSWER